MELGSDYQTHSSPPPPPHMGEDDTTKGSCAPRGRKLTNRGKEADEQREDGKEKHAVYRGRCRQLIVIGEKMETFREGGRRPEKGWKHSERWIKDKKKDGNIQRGG